MEHQKGAPNGGSPVAMNHERDLDPSLAEILSHPDISARIRRSSVSSEDLPKIKHGSPHKFLVHVSVVDSAGPLRLIVESNSTVEQVIKEALQQYEYEGRLPPLGTDPRHFELYSAHDISEALDEKFHIGDARVRDFILQKRPNAMNEKPEEGNDEDHSTSWRSRLLHTVAAHFNHRPPSP